MRIVASGQTDRGCQRSRNEDWFLVDQELGLFVVCDGMGGHAAGDIASQNAVLFARQFMERHRESIAEAAALSVSSGARLASLVERCVHEVNDRLRSLSCRMSSLVGMGTTLTLLLVAGEQGVVGHVGDSQLYLSRGGVVRKITVDHTLANELRREGVLLGEEAQRSPYHQVLTRCIGHEKRLLVDTSIIDLQPGDVFLICSDGLSKMIDVPREAGSFLDEEPADAAADLIALANQRGGLDNITAVLVRAGERAAPTVREGGPAIRTDALPIAAN